jgi:hypothetical protein
MTSTSAILQRSARSIGRGSIVTVRNRSIVIVRDTPTPIRSSRELVRPVTSIDHASTTRMNLTGATACGGPMFPATPQARGCGTLSVALEFPAENPALARL